MFHRSGKSAVHEVDAGKSSAFHRLRHSPSPLPKLQYLPLSYSSLLSFRLVGLTEVMERKPSLAEFNCSSRQSSSVSAYENGLLIELDVERRSPQ